MIVEYIYNYYISVRKLATCAVRPSLYKQKRFQYWELTFSTYVLERLNARKRLRSDATNENQTIVLNAIIDRERNSETDPSSSVHYSESKTCPRRQIQPFEIEVRTDTIAKIDDSETTWVQIFCVLTHTY